MIIFTKTSVLTRDREDGAARAANGPYFGRIRPERQAVDPEALANPQWSELGDLLTNLWLMVAFIVIFAANMLIAHNWVPSFVRSAHIDASFARTRPVFYVLSLSAFGAAMYFLARVVDHSGVLRDFWPNYWI